jgi:hypothetical protein
MVRPQFFLTESPSDHEWEPSADDNDEEKHAELRGLPGDRYASDPSDNHRRTDQCGVDSAYDYPDWGLMVWVMSSDD